MLLVKEWKVIRVLWYFSEFGFLMNKKLFSIWI